MHAVRARVALAFLLGLHSRVGSNSSMWRAWNSPLEERHLLRVVLSFL